MSDLGLPPISDPQQIDEAIDASLPKVGDQHSYNKVKAGDLYINDEGKRKQKPFQFRRPTDWDSIPEGATYVDPTGAHNTKPRTESMSPGLQILYGMAPDDYRRKEILRIAYGDRGIRQSPSGKTIIHSGDKWIDPNKGWGGYVGDIAPTGGAVGGSVAGFAVGGPPGAYVGSGVGAGLGQGLNDAILEVFGIGPESVLSEVGDIGAATGYGVVGEGVGRLAGRAIGGLARGGMSLVEGLKQARHPGDVLPTAVRYAFGTTPEGLERAHRLALGEPERGLPSVRTPPSQIHPEAPMLRLIAEEFDPPFREFLSPFWEPPPGVSPEQFAAALRVPGGRTPFYEAAAKRLTAEMGIEREVPFLRPGHALDLLPAGTEAQAAASSRMIEASTALREATEAAKREAASRRHGEATAIEGQTKSLREAAATFRSEAEQLIQHGLNVADLRALAAMEKAGAGEHPGDLWRLTGQQINRLSGLFAGTVQRLYDGAYAQSQATPLVLTPAIRAAQAQIETLPQDFENLLPGAARQLRDIATPKPTGSLDVEGKEIMAPPNVTLRQAHELRKLLTARVNWNNPNADSIEGTRKQLVKAVDQWIHDPAQPAQVKAGVAILDQTDGYYAKIKPKFEQATIETIIKEMKTGFTPNASKLAELIFDKDNTYALENARKLLGPQLWQGVQAADARRVILASRELPPGVSGEAATNPSKWPVNVGKLSAIVEQRVKDGMWEGSSFGTDIAKLSSQAKLAAAKGSIPLEASEGDTIVSLLQRANSYAAEAEHLAKVDPLRALKEESAALERKLFEDERRLERDPLAQALGVKLEDAPSVLTMAATERILSNPDLILAAAHQFGKESPAFTLLRSAKIQQMLEGGGIQEVLDLPPPIRQLLFTDEHLAKAVYLAETVQFLTGKGKTFGGGIAATGRVTRPEAEIEHFLPGVGHKFRSIPIVGTVAARMGLGKAFGLITDFSTSEPFLRWLKRGMKPGEPLQTTWKDVIDRVQERYKGAETRAAATKVRSRRGGHVGAGLGASLANRDKVERVPRRPTQAGDAALQGVRP